MAQNVVDFSDNPTGAELMDDYLAKDQQNVLTSNSGIQRPSYAVAGTKWLDTSVTPWLWKMYDGTNDITLGTVNPSTHLFTPAGVLPSQDGQSGKFLQTNGTSTVWTDAVDYTNITNCITAIPQDIKLELNNGTLTLKAGSKPRDGQGNIIDIDTDSSITFTQDKELMVFVRADTKSITVRELSQCYSGDVQPNSSYYNWYDTSNKVVKSYGQNNYFEYNTSLPIAIVTSSGGAISSIDQVFNGFGYIGSTVFALPNVEGLIPNGRNTDGSLNNTKFKTSSVLTFTNSITRNNANISISPDNGIILRNTLLYDENLNRNYNGSIYNDEINCGTSSTDSTGRITSFNPKTVFRAPDCYDVPKLATDNTFTGVNTFNKNILFQVNADDGQTPSTAIGSKLASINLKERSLSSFESFVESNGATQTVIVSRAYNSSGSNVATTALRVYANQDGSNIISGVTPTTTDNTSKLATTQFVNNFFNTAGRITAKCVPNYGAGVGIGTGTTVIPKASVLIITPSQPNYANLTVTVNGVEVFRYGGDEYLTLYKVPILIPANSTVVITGSLSNATYYPLVGA